LFQVLAFIYHAFNVRHTLLTVRGYQDLARTAEKEERAHKKKEIFIDRSCRYFDRCRFVCVCKLFRPVTILVALAKLAPPL
jgi:hypothetical protein